MTLETHIAHVIHHKEYDTTGQSWGPRAHVEKAHDSLRSYSTVVLGPRVGYPLNRGTNED
jgi:hypothetical protein